MADQENNTPSFWPWHLRKMADERKQRELEKFGEKGYAERQAGIDRAVDEVITWVTPLMEEARSRDFKYFRCSLDLGRAASTAFGIRMQFADGKGNYFERCPGFTKILEKYVGHASIPEHWDVVDAIHSFVRQRGFGMLESRMCRQRVKLNKRQMDDAGA
jgi:hypothetical protein